jgi:hypothetical protein
MSKAEKLRDLLTNAQMPDNATLTVTLGELRAAFGSSDPEAVGLDASDIHAADVAASLVHDYIWQKPVLSGTTPPSKEQASDAIWTIHRVLRPLLARLNPPASDDAYERGRADERKAQTFLIEHTPREPGPVDLRPEADQ